MDKLKKTNQHAYDWLKENNPTHWSMSHFSIRIHSDMLVNNLSESFNKGKPILTMMETIMTKIMLLIVKKKEEVEKWKGMLCPKIRKKLDVNIKDSLRCVPSHAGGDRHIKVRRKEPDEPQATERLSKRGVDMRSKDTKLVFKTKWFPQLSNSYPKSTREYPKSIGCPNSVTNCPNL
ncbi:hypothetical protein GOBAR_DD13555 [Gossypium barbadense]|nr:hypothetical protein GOBAR_DD13555 [Gossypium barbadense]